MTELPQAMLPASQADEAELIARSMAGADIGPLAFGPVADATRHRADEADTELERRAYRRHLEGELEALRAKAPTDYTTRRIATLTDRLERMS